MAEIRCPMCGKTNPSEAERCRFCGARLIPLAPSPHEPAPGKDIPQGGEDDWLGSLRSGATPFDQDGESTGEELDSSPVEEVPDWLSRIQSLPSKEEPEHVPQPPSDEVNLDAWLSSLDQEKGETGASGINRAPQAGQETPDWLRELSATTPAPVEEAPQESVPDWLAGLSAPESDFSETGAPQADSTTSDASAALDWLNSLAPVEETMPLEPDTQVAPENLEAPETLSEAENLVMPENLVAPEMPLVEPPLDKTQPDISPAEPELLDLPPVEDAFSSLAVEPELPAAENLPAMESMPDWLSDFALKGSQAGETAESLSPGDLHAWDAEPSASAQPAYPDGPLAQPAESLPDWMKDMSRPEGEKLPAVPHESDLGWLNQFAEDIQTSPTGEPSAAMETPPGIETLPPAVFSGMVETPAESQPGFELPGLPELPSQPETSIPLQPATPGQPALPAWLANFKQATPESTAGVEAGLEPEVQSTDNRAGESLREEALPQAVEGPQSSSDLPEWLVKVTSDSAAQGSLMSVSPLLSVESTGVTAETPPAGVASLGGDLPDWLSKPGAEGEKGEGEPAELTPAELPVWVEAMRPVQAGLPGGVSLEEMDNRVEQAGPLAGLQGVVPVQGIPAVTRKTPVYTGALQVSERQRQNAILLEEVLAEETRPFPVPARRGDAPRLLFRLIIGLLLILSFVLWSISGFEFTAPPAAPPQVRSLFQSLDRLPEGAPVLLAVDYEGGLSGEMRLASSAVVRHLMEKNLRLAALSTLPVGSALAADLVQQSQKGLNYSLAEQFANLGYLAGGTTSLVELVNSPLPKSFPTALDGRPFQTVNALQSVSSLRDFAAVVLLTDSPETARAWIEQVQAPMQQTGGGRRLPFYVVSSAQAAPQIRPYLEGGQVQGLVSGLVGGAAYEQAAQRPGGANLFWGAYQLGIIFSILILLAGGLIQVVADLSRGTGKRG